MWDIKKQIFDAAELFNIFIEQLESTQTIKIFSDIEKKYVKNKIKFPLWENLKEASSISDEESWKLLEDFVGDNISIMFFNPNDEEGFYKIMNGKDVVSILGEMYNIEFYLTNEANSYLICYNHHDILIGSGEAKFWLEKYYK